MSPETVLIVDDDQSFCSALARALRRRELNVLVSHNYEEALAEAEAWQPAKAIVDLRMPGKGGLELVRDLLRHKPDLKIVVLTGYGSIATAVEAMKLGAHHYLTKPASAEEVLKGFERHDPDAAVDPAQGPMPLECLEWEHIEQVLANCHGNVSAAARQLGIHRRTLQRKLARKRP